MDMKVYAIDGKEKSKIKLDDKVFGIDVSEGTIYYVIKNELANKRVGTACTKTRREVKGTTAKPYNQKGTGRARAGRWKSPVRRGGGIVFGPKPRDYSYTTPKKMKRKAMKSILSLKAQEDETMKIIENFTIESGKTKDLAVILKNFVQNERTVLIIQDDDALLRRAGRNIPNLSMLSYNRLSAHTLFYGKKVLVLEGAAQKLNDFYKD